MGLTKLSQKELKQKLAGRSKDLKDILKDEVLNEAVVRRVMGLIELCEGIIDQYEYNEIQKLKKTQTRIIEFSKLIDGEVKFDQLLNVLNAIKSATKKIHTNLKKEKFQSSKMGHQLFFQKTFDDMAFARSVIEETQKLEALDSDIDLMKANRLVRSLICEIEFDFKHMYNLRKKLSGFVTAFLKKISSISDLQSIVKTEIISLRLKEQKYSDLLSSQVEYVLNRTYHLIKILTYLERHDRVNKSLTPLLQDHEINFQKIVHVKLAEYGVSFRKARSLDINYKCSEKTFLRESKRLVGDRLFIQRNSVEDVKKCINILYNLIKLIRQEYVHKCDSPYHGIEHVSQVTITTLRIFIKYQRIHKSVNLVDFFIVMSAAILHDVGYFTEHFRHSAPGYLSSMYHDGHEIRSAKHAKKYLSHFRKEIESLGIGLFDELIKSIQNVISSTRVRGDSFREDLDVELQKILRASDLLEMCSERYINYLIPLYKENKIGDPKCAWPVSLHELISGTPFFMTQLELVQKRVKLMIDYLDAYPVYKQNLDAISHNLVAYEQVLKKEQKVHEGLMVDFERKG